MSDPGRLFRQHTSSNRVIANRFEILDESALGGMAEVRRAWDRWTGMFVAVKRLRTPTDDHIERFRREAAVLRGLEHPGIVAYIAEGESSDGEFYLVMEWLDGEDLASRLLRHKRLSIAECLSLALRLTDALGAAHAQGIIHRDLKPSNLFLEAGRVDRVKMLDFGLARFMGASNVLTRAGMAVGTPAYMAPEQVLADAHVDTRADVWSLGCVLYECLTGEPPFQGEQISSVFLKILHENPRSPRQLRPDVPSQLDALVASMLLKKSEERPRDGAEVLQRLRALDRSSAFPPPTTPTLGRSEQRIMAFVMVLPDPSFSVVDAISPTMPVVRAEASERAVRDAVDAHGGELRTLADGSMAISFTVKGVASDLAKQAARCALAVQSHWPRAHIAVTLGSGDAAARKPVGDALERVASLMKQLDTTPTPEVEKRPIRIDDTIAGLLDASFELGGDALGLFLLGEHDLGFRPRSVLGKPSKCIGRERELGTLRAVFNECVDEPIARVVILTGPPGIGKTRICHEFLAGLSNLDPPAEVWYGRGQPSTAGAPLAMLAMGLRIMAHLVDGEDPQVSRQKLVARVSRHVPEERARGVAEFLGELVGSPFSAVESPGLRAARQDPVLMAQRVRSAWEELLAAESASQPVVLVLEDLHWGDVATVKFVDGALRRFADKPLFVLATAPSTGALDAFPNLWAERAPLETRLTPLTPKASERLLRAFLGSATDSTIAALVQHGAGNPLFLEELIRAYATGDDTELPETLLAMTQSRLERLDAEPRRALRAASVFGMSFTKDGLGALLGETYGAGDLERSLTYLSEAELIEPNVDAWPNHGYTFRQDIIRRAAYSMLTEEDRILGHGLAARWLVEKAMGSPSEIAKHFDEGGQAERAARWYLAAAEEAFRASDFVAVLDWTDRAMMLGAQGELRGALLALQTAIGLARNEVEEAEYIGADAMALLPPGSARWCQVAGTTGVIALMLRPSRHLEEVHERLLAQVPAADAYAAHATALAAVGLLYARIGDHEVLTRIATVAEKSAAQLDSVDVATLGRIALLNTYLAGTHEGDAYAHLTFAQDAELAFAKLDDPAYAISIGTEIGWALLTLGAYEAAEERLRGVIAHAHRNGMTLQAAYVGLFHALALAHLGQGERAAQLAHESRTYCASRLVDALAAPILGRIAMLRGDFAAAEHALEGIEALDTSMNLLHAEACVVRAWLLLEQGNAPEALRLVRAIVAWSDRPGGAGHNESLMRLIYARSLEAVGDVDGARAELRVAHDRLSARAETIGDTTLRSSFLERVPENAATLTLSERLG